LGWNERPKIIYDDDFRYDEDREASISDSISWGWWGIKNTGAEILRPDLDDATDAYSHFRNGGGADYIIDLGEGIREDPAIRSFVDEQIEGAKEAAIELHEHSGLNEFVMTGSAVPTNAEYYPETENWQKTIGGYNMWCTAVVSVNGNTYSMELILNVDDIYNFNAGQQDIASGAPDSENGNFEELGWGNEYHVTGNLRTYVDFNNE
jgi:hypothetical protein